MMRAYLQFVNRETGERAENPGKVEITGKSDREIEKLERGMLRQCSDDWYVDHLTEGA